MGKDQGEEKRWVREDQELLRQSRPGRLQILLDRYMLVITTQQPIQNGQF